MNIYEIITNKIIEKLEEGTTPWHKAWATTQTPFNYATGKDYRGINTLLLAGYDDPRFMTFNQVKTLKGSIKKGAKSQIIVFWSTISKSNNNIETDEINEEDETKFVLKYYNVFNAQDIEGIDFPKIEITNNNTKIEDAEQLANAYLSQIKSFNHGGDRAYYSPSLDHIQMPKFERFESSEEYYSTLFHEIAHSTGHETRLNRKGVTESKKFGSHDYSYEELIAEISSAFLCNFVKIENTFDNSAAYIHGWSKALKDNKKMIILAASQAQKVSDYILSFTQNHKSIAA
ncbi:MAG: zincin-like metallopeptidase domain-containing protein [Arcobacteraceae bacterium]|jgi:antirestriction protein ArdC|nr:zincin-like metallopeptidase domain-containing protein [Arcobacteraceae bacterium]